MCSLFGLIDFKECLSTHTKNKILNILARECQVRGTDATGIAYNFNDRLRIYSLTRTTTRSLVTLTETALLSHTTECCGTTKSYEWKKVCQ